MDEETVNETFWKVKKIIFLVKKRKKKHYTFKKLSFKNLIILLRAFKNYVFVTIVTPCVTTTRLFCHLCAFLLLTVLQRNPMSCKRSCGWANRQVEEGDRKWRVVLLTGCKLAVASLCAAAAVWLAERLTEWLMVPLSLSPSAGRVPAPLWRGEAWGSTTQERVSSKLCTCRRPKWAGQRKTCVFTCHHHHHHSSSPPSVHNSIPMTLLLC